MIQQISNHQRQYRYYDFIMAAFVTVLLCSNIIGAAKVSTIHLPWLGNFTFGAGILFFPISYIFGDILTEVYGYARARRVVWSGFIALLFASGMSWVVLSLPPANGWPHQAAYAIALGSTPRIVLASILAFWAGELTNSFTLAKMKLWTQGSWLWTRTIGSTIAGEAVDSMLFYPLAFAGVWDNELVIQVMLTNYCLKTLWEIINTPITYRIVAWLKRVEQEDYFDWNTNFTPFSLET